MSSCPLRTALIALALALATAACAAGASGFPAPPPGPPLSGQATVVLEDLTFQPDALHITRGTTVIWKWADGSTEHNVVFDDFASGIQTQGTYQHTFNEPGEFTYRCSLHADMTGVVAVD